MAKKAALVRLDVPAIPAAMRASMRPYQVDGLEVIMEQAVTSRLKFTLDDGRILLNPIKLCPKLSGFMDKSQPLPPEAMISFGVATDSYGNRVLLARGCLDPVIERLEALGGAFDDGAVLDMLVFNQLDHMVLSFDPDSAEKVSFSMRFPYLGEVPTHGLVAGFLKSLRLNYFNGFLYLLGLAEDIS